MNDLRIALYHNLHSGGAKRVVEEQARRLSAAHTVHVYSTSAADLAFARDTANAASVSILQYRTLPFAPSPFGRFNPALWLINLARLDALARQTAKMIDDANFDVALVHPCQMTQAPLVLRYLKTPSLYYCHELPRKLYEPDPARPQSRRRQFRRTLDRIDPLLKSWEWRIKYLDRASAQRATRIASNSKFTSGNIQAAYARSSQVCYPGVDAGAFQPSPRARESFVLSVGALTPSKGFDWIIRALGELPSATRPSLVLICNYQEMDERNYLNDLAERLQVQVDFRVGVTEAELQDAYARARCVVYAPIREPLGLVALEAMAAGAPLIGVAEGGVAETIIDNVTGLLVPRDPSAIAQAIDQLGTRQEFARQLGEQAREHVREHWTWEQHITSVENILTETEESK